MNEVVLDASVAAIALIGTNPEADELRRRLDEHPPHAPHLIDAEVGSFLRRRAAAAGIEPDRAGRALQTLNVLVGRRHPHGPLSNAAWSLRHNLSYYDALYVALAARLGVPLLTADARLARAPGVPCDVELVSPPPTPAAATPS